MKTTVLLQRALLETLYKISDLKYTLSVGNESKNRYNYLLSVYTKQVEQVGMRLKEWHKSGMLKYGIDIENNIRKRTGLDNIMHKIPSLIKEELGYRQISASTSSVIDAQINKLKMKRELELDDWYDRDVNIIMKEGKAYYLP